MKIVRYADAPEFTPAGHAGVVNRALVSDEWQETPEVSVWWGRFSAGGEADLHAHDGATQVYVVLSGSFVVGDGEREHRLEARDTAIIAAGELHRIRADAEAGVLVITVPALR